MSATTDNTDVIAAWKVLKQKRDDAISKANADCKDAISKANADYEAALDAMKGKMSEAISMLKDLGLLGKEKKTSGTRNISELGNINKIIGQKKRALKEAKKRKYTPDKIAQYNSEITELEKKKKDLEAKAK